MPQELGLEGFDRFTDKYHDKAYELAAKGIPRRKSKSKQARAAPRDSADGPPKASSDINHDRKSADARRDSSHSHGDRRYSSHQNQTAREDLRGAPPHVEEVYDERNQYRQEHGFNPYRQQPARPYPYDQQQYGYNPPSFDQARQAPPYQPYYPGYPYTAGAYAAQQDRSYLVDSEDEYDDRRRPRHRERSRSRSLYADDRRAEYSRSPPRSRLREKSRTRSEKGEDRSSDHKKSHSLGASVVGAVAGGLLGREMGEGDRLALVAGAVLGAVGAGVAEKKYSSHKTKRKLEQEEWEKVHGDGAR